MLTTINFLADVPRLGTSLCVKESLNEVTQKLIVADRFEHTTISFTKPDGGPIVVPTKLIGPVEGDKQKPEEG
jgi:hypothetical protein